MVRIFAEADVFSTGAADNSFTVLRGSVASDKTSQRAAPAYIDNPFSEKFLSDHMRIKDIPLVDEYCLEVPEAVLFGERAVVSRGNSLLTDFRYLGPWQVNFSAVARNFEKMSPTEEVDHGISSDRVDNPVYEINETAALLSSWEHMNYGAVLLRQIPKVLMLRELALDEIPVISPASSWHRQLLEIFGITKIIEHDRQQSYFCKNLILPSQKTRSFFFGEDVKKLFMNTAERISKEVGTRKGELVYVSRISQGKKNPKYRRCINEEELVDALKPLGFSIVEPEAYSIKEQISIFQGVRMVVGPSGAGMFNTVFCPPGTKIVSVEPLPNWFYQHCNMFASMGHDFGFITGGAIENDEHPIQKSWIADVPVILKRIKEKMSAL